MIRPTFVIIDPLQCYLGEKDMNKATETRERVCAAAAWRGLAVWCRLNDADWLIDWLIGHDDDDDGHDDDDDASRDEIIDS